jgi:hypothetical protein
MGNSIPGDPTLVAQILKITSAYTPPPPEGFVSPMLWGVEAEVIARFGAVGVPADAITFSRETWSFSVPKPPSALVDDFIMYYGPTMNAFDAARASGREESLTKELDQLFGEQNMISDPSVTSIAATYLRVTVTTAT